MKTDFVVILSILGVMTFFLTGPVMAQQTVLPAMDENGDFNGPTTHMYWKVTDSDPEGLNGRLSYDFPLTFDNRGSHWPEMDVVSWPVIRKFRKGTILTANTKMMGSIVKDTRGLPWLKVEIGAIDTNDAGGDVVCFVRANSRYVVPVMDPGPGGEGSLNIGVIRSPDGYANVRLGPHHRTKIISRIYENSPYLFLDFVGVWRKIVTPYGQIGYLHGSKFFLGKYHYTCAWGAARVKDPDGYVNLRWGPSISSPVVTRVKNKEVVFLVAPDKFNKPVGSWAPVLTSKGQKGYIHKSRLLWLPI